MINKTIGVNWLVPWLLVFGKIPPFPARSGAQTTQEELFSAFSIVRKEIDIMVQKTRSKRPCGEKSTCYTISHNVWSKRISSNDFMDRKQCRNYRPFQEDPWMCLYHNSKLFKITFIHILQSTIFQINESIAAYSFLASSAFAKVIK